MHVLYDTEIGNGQIRDRMLRYGSTDLQKDKRWLLANYSLLVYALAVVVECFFCSLIIYKNNLQVV